MGLLSNRRRYGNKIKPYDAEIEYLEHNPQDGDTCYIDTGYVPTGYDNDIYCEFMLLDYPTNLAWETTIFIAYTNEQSNAYRIIRNGNSNTQALIYNGSIAGEGGGTDVKITQGVKHSLSLLRDNFVLDMGSGTLRTKRGNENTATLKFWSHATDKFAAHARIYSFRLDKGGETILDLIPVRIGNKGFMYNKVDEKLYGNQGTGIFVLGPDIK